MAIFKLSGVESTLLIVKLSPPYVVLFVGTVWNTYIIDSANAATLTGDISPPTGGLLIGYSMLLSSVM